MSGSLALMTASNDYKENPALNNILSTGNSTVGVL